MSELLLVPLLAVHLLCVNVASAGPLVAIWLDWRANRDELAARVGRFLVWISFILLVAGSCFGLLLGFSLWSDSYRSVFELFQRRIYFGFWEILFSLVLMLFCASWWSLVPKSSTVGRSFRSLLQVLAATNLLYHFPFLFVVLSDVANGHTSPKEVIDAADFRQIIATGSVWIRVVHIWLASFAVTGITLIGFALWYTPRGDDEAFRASVWGGRIALLPTMLQIPVGLWVLVQLPRAAQQRLLGGDIFGSSLLVVSIVGALGLLHLLAAVAFGDASRKTQSRTVSLMLLVVFLMTVVLKRV